jgi:hypothetical protein
MNRALSGAAAVLCAFAVAITAVPASADGLAWDSVMKVSMDGSVGQPGNFADDFRAASQASAPPAQHGGLFGGIINAANAANAALRSLRNGFAERHAVAGNFLRSDDLTNQTATIIDCQARTLTTLDLAKKTYRTTSLDAPVQSNPSTADGRRAPGPLPTDDGSKIDVKVTGSALGSKTIDGIAADGYSLVMTTTVTKPSGESQSFDMVMTTYLSRYAQPAESCARLGFTPPTANMPSMATYQGILRAMLTPNGDPRVTVSASGPSMPAGRFPLYISMTPKAAGGRGAFAMSIENGHVREISDADKSLFSVPPDFTQLP